MSIEIIKNILAENDIEFNFESRENEDVFYCKNQPIEDCDAVLLFKIAIDKTTNIFSIISKGLYTVNEEHYEIVLKLINEENRKIPYGTWYVDDDGELMIYIGVSLESNRQIAGPELQDYLHHFIAEIILLSEILVEQEGLVENESNIS